MEKQALIRAMKRSISEVMETMFYFPVECADTAEAGGRPQAEPGPASAVRLDFRGPFSGAFFLLVPEAFVAALAENFMGRDKGSISSASLIETSKEIINMIAGNTFAILDDRAVFDLGFPEIVLRDEAPTPAGSGLEIVVGSDVTEHRLWVRMILER